MCSCILNQGKTTKYTCEKKMECVVVMSVYSKLHVIWYPSTMKPLFIVFVGGLKKKQLIRENNRCGSHSWNRICSGTIEIEGWIWENELSGNDRSRFHCIWNSHWASTNYKKIYHFYKVKQKQICDVRMFTCRAVVLSAATSSTIHCPPSQKFHYNRG
jgi:hypothetical protein